MGKHWQAVQRAREGLAQTRGKHQQDGQGGCTGGCSAWPCPAVNWCDRAADVMDGAARGYPVGPLP